MRLCLHIDMDCFYAAVEERENPSLKGRPVAVGGASRRSVICTANYEARKYGCRSAMPNYMALRLCPDLVIVPLQFDLYKDVSRQIQSIYKQYTKIIEPLSLDEAYLDLGEYREGGAHIAASIRAHIFRELHLTASAGIAPNKMLAKIASDWHKPNGQFEITKNEVEGFIRELPVARLHGVGTRMQERLFDLGVETCLDLQRFDRFYLVQLFGRWGNDLYDRCRGIDHRSVESYRSRKSISKETTFSDDIQHQSQLYPVLVQMKNEIQTLLLSKYNQRKIKSLVVKLKFLDFTHTTAECLGNKLDEGMFRDLLHRAWQRGGGKSVRLFGVGVKLAEEESQKQLELF